MNSVRFLYFVRHKEKLLSDYVFTLNSSGAAQALADRLLSHLGRSRDCQRCFPSSVETRLHPKYGVLFKQTHWHLWSFLSACDLLSYWNTFVPSRCGYSVMQPVFLNDRQCYLHASPFFMWLVIFQEEETLLGLYQLMLYLKLVLWDTSLQKLCCTWIQNNHSESSLYYWKVNPNTIFWFYLFIYF